MSERTDIGTMALFCDFENIAIGVRESNLQRFNMKLVLEKLLLRGPIIVKKAYCDWGRYHEFKEAMHEAAFELIDIPHVRQSGKNSADIRLVVDALDLCYTKPHVRTFVIMSGDSDFSPLVSKLRENNKYVVGVGVKNSSSDLLIANCDEFIFYDDLARELEREKSRPRRSPLAKGVSVRKQNERGDPAEGIELVVNMAEELLNERGGEDKVWGSMVKQALKRRHPQFNESYYGFRNFTDLLEEAERRELLTLERDEKSGGFVITSCHRANLERSKV